jgi:anti-sigma factor RsiW
MTGQIIPLHGDEHHEAQLLLPWFANGSLAPQEHARVRAHVATCPECQADLTLERRLDVAVAELPVEAAEPHWNELRARLPPVRRKSATRTAVDVDLGPLVAGPLSGWRVGPRTLGWAVAAQFVMLLLLGSVLVMRPPAQPATYQALGAAPAPAMGNLVVIFRPETRERDLRAILNASGARLVDGPTAADAYVLHVPPAQRADILLKLRARPEIVLAEPIDAGGRP